MDVKSTLWDVQEYGAFTEAVQYVLVDRLVILVESFTMAPITVSAQRSQGPRELLPV